MHLSAHACSIMCMYYIMCLQPTHAYTQFSIFYLVALFLIITGVLIYNMELPEKHVNKEEEDLDKSTKDSTNGPTNVSKGSKDSQGLQLKRLLESKKRKQMNKE